MQRLIADLLDESRLRTGRLPLEYGDHLVSQLLADVSELRPLAQQKRVRVDVVPPARDRLVACDRARMSQVLGNLLVSSWAEISRLKSGLPPPHPSSRFALRAVASPKSPAARAQGEGALGSTGNVVDEGAERFT